MTASVVCALRSPPFPFFPESLHDPEHVLPCASCIYGLAAHGHVDLLLAVRHQQLLQKEVFHLHAHEHAAIVSILLPRTVREVQKAELFVEQCAQLLRRRYCFGFVGRVEAVVMEGHAIRDAHHEERPV